MPQPHSVDLGMVQSGICYRAMMRFLAQQTELMCCCSDYSVCLQESKFTGAAHPSCIVLIHVCIRLPASELTLLPLLAYFHVPKTDMRRSLAQLGSRTNDESCIVSAIPYRQSEKGCICHAANFELPW